MTSFRGRLLLAKEAAAAEGAAPKNSPQGDPWFAPTGRLKGRVDWDGWEYIQSQQIMDALEVPVHARRGGLFRKLTRLMRAHGWEPIRIKQGGVHVSGVTDRTRPRRMSSARLFRP